MRDTVLCAPAQFVLTLPVALSFAHDGGLGPRAELGVGSRALSVVAGRHTTRPDVALACSVLLSRTLLHNLNALASAPDFHTLWLKVIGLLAHNMSVTKEGTTLHESTLHFVTNLLMVMAHSRVLEAVSERSGQNVLELTWRILDSLCPHVRERLREFAPSVSEDGATVPAEGEAAGEVALHQTV